MENECNHFKYVRITATEEQQIRIVAKFPSMIRMLSNPSELAQKIALDVILYSRIDIENPSLETQLAMVNYRGQFLQRIKNPCLLVQKAALNQDGEAIEFIENPSVHLQLIAVRNNPYAIRHIENPHERVIMTAVSTDWSLIRLVPNPSNAVCMAAICNDRNNHNSAICYIKNPSNRMLKEAIKRRPSLIKGLQKNNIHVPDFIIKESVLGIGPILLQRIFFDKELLEFSKSNIGVKFFKMHNETWGWCVKI